MIIGVCVGSVALILNVAVPAIAKEAIDSTIAGNKEELTVWALILIVVGLGDLRQVHYTESRYSESPGSRDRFACITVQPSDEAELLLL